MQIAVIILNYNSSSDCRKCVSTLKEQTGVELEIVIVDNCSQKNGEQQIIKKLCIEQGCTFITAKENRGYNAGNNIGLRYAADKGYKYAMIANPDMEFQQKDYIYRLANKMEGNNNIAVISSDIIIDGIHQNPMKRDGDWKNSFGWIKGLIKKEEIDTYSFIDNYNKSHFCSKVSGCCLMVRIKSMIRIDFFDEYPFLYCEEAILSRQIERIGLSMYYMADCQAIHAHIESKKGKQTKRFEQWKRSRIYFIKHYSGDSWYGKRIAIMSMDLYVILFKLNFYIKNHF